MFKPKTEAPFLLALLQYIENEEIDVKTMRPVIEAIKRLIMEEGYTFLVLTEGEEKKYEYLGIITSESYKFQFEKSLMVDFVEFIKDKKPIVVFDNKNIKIKTFNTNYDI